MSSIIQWMAWAERRMASLCIQERLDVAMLGATQGPLTVTFTLRLLRPSKVELARLLVQPWAWSIRCLGGS